MGKIIMEIIGQSIVAALFVSFCFFLIFGGIIFVLSHTPQMAIDAFYRALLVVFVWVFVAMLIKLVNQKFDF